MIHEVIIDGIRYVPEKSEPEPHGVDRASFFGVVRASLFGGSLRQAQVDGCETLLDTCVAAGLDPLDAQTAYVLATVYHETGRRMEPVRETFATSDESAISRLEGAWAAGRMPSVKTPYWRKDETGRSWFGRGYVQLTWERNYAKMEDKLKGLGIDQYQVHQHPSLAMVPAVSAAICVYGMRDGEFTGRSLDDYIGREQRNYVEARRIVNGTDNAKAIAGYADKFLEALQP